MPANIEPEAPRILPEILPSVGAEHEKEEENSDVDISDARGGLLDKWKQHEQYSMGMRLAELSVMWHVNGWSNQKFPCFLAWATKHFPYAFGHLNHSRRFLDSFSPSVVQATHTCLASTLHACVPALGMPSFLSRIIDVVSINGRSLLPTIHVFTDSQGHLSWALLGCPCLEYTDKEQIASLAAAFGAGQAASAASPAAISGAAQIVLFFTKERQVGQTVHPLEKTYHIDRDDRAMRLITTVADNAIQGPNSVHFSEEERRVDNLEDDMLAEAICKFHIADCVGGGVDKQSIETILYDRLLRLVRRHFAFGTGDIILRGVATKFSSIAQMFDAQQEALMQSVADAEAQNQPLAAERLAKRAQKCGAEAVALHRAGWTKWSRPRAPKADGTRKVVWQTKARDSFFQLYGLVYWGLLARMQQTLERARAAAQSQGSRVTQTQDCKRVRCDLGEA